MPATTKVPRKDVTTVRRIAIATTTISRVIATPTRITARDWVIGVCISATTGWRLRVVTILRIHHPIAEIEIGITTAIAMGTGEETGTAMERTAARSICDRQL